MDHGDKKDAQDQEAREQEEDAGRQEQGSELAIQEVEESQEKRRFLAGDGERTGPNPALPDLGCRVASERMPLSRLLHWDLVDEGVPLHRDDDVGRLDRAVGGAIGAGDREDQGARLSLQRGGLGSQGQRPDTGSDLGGPGRT